MVSPAGEETIAMCCFFVFFNEWMDVNGERLPYAELFVWENSF